MFDTELTRKLRSAPALAPLPPRQPMGDCYFPSAVPYPVSIPVGADGEVEKAIKKRSRILLDASGEEIGLAIDDAEEEETVELGPIDIVSRLWTF